MAVDDEKLHLYMPDAGEEDSGETLCGIILSKENMDALILTQSVEVFEEAGEGQCLECVAVLLDLKEEEEYEELFGGEGWG